MAPAPRCRFSRMHRKGSTPPGGLRQDLLPPFALHSRAVTAITSNSCANIPISSRRFERRRSLGPPCVRMAEMCAVRPRKGARSVFPGIKATPLVLMRKIPISRWSGPDHSTISICPRAHRATRWPDTLIMIVQLLGGMLYSAFHRETNPTRWWTTRRNIIHGRH